MDILTIGDSAVGKSTLLNMYETRMFNKNHVASIGLDKILTEFKQNDHEFRVQLWDSAGQENYKNITKNFIKSAHGILIVFSLIDRQTFNSVKQWISCIHQNCDESIPKILVGNKCDLNDQRTVSNQEAEELATSFGIKFIETSAKSNHNV